MTERRISQKFTKAKWFGWYCETTHGVFVVGEGPLWAMTYMGIVRKANRLFENLCDEDRRYEESIVIKR
jgi:hypothetical protein